MLACSNGMVGVCLGVDEDGVSVGVGLGVWGCVCVCVCGWGGGCRGVYVHGR
jgi:hypothetical protein